jgi:Cd2+/Zn2+-exporting ATPase
VAVVSAVGGAARRGILVKGGQALEDLGRVRTVALDKTGTLTAGVPQLERVAALDGLSETEALRLVAAVEASSEHPLAAALRRAAADRGLDVPAADGFTALPGRGAQATVDGRELWAGGPRLAAERTGATPEGLAELHAGGQTAIALGEGDRVLALFGLADQPREDAAGLVAALREAGVERTVMLTGDAEPVARAIAARAGVPRSAPACCPRTSSRRSASSTRRRRPRWSATASTTHRRWPPRASAWRWASRAATQPSRPPTSR